MNQQEFLNQRHLYLFGKAAEKRCSGQEIYQQTVSICKQVIAVRQLKAETSEMEDIIQETASAVLFHIANFQTEFSHKTWISKIFHNKFLDSLRAKKRRGGFAVFSIDLNWENEEGTETTFDICDEYHCVADRIHYQNLIDEVSLEAKKCLKQTQLEIWKMKWEEDMCNQEIAKRLGKDKNYIAVNWMRAKESVIKNLEKKGKYDEVWLITSRGGKMAA